MESLKKEMSSGENGGRGNFFVSALSNAKVSLRACSVAIEQVQTRIEEYIFEIAARSPPNLGARPYIATLEGPKDVSFDANPEKFWLKDAMTLHPAPCLDIVSREVFESAVRLSEEYKSTLQIWKDKLSKAIDLCDEDGSHKTIPESTVSSNPAVTVTAIPLELPSIDESELIVHEPQLIDMEIASERNSQWEADERRRQLQMLDAATEAASVSEKCKNFIRKFLENIVKYPEDSKYRKLKVRPQTKTSALLATMGFRVIEEINGFEKYYAGIGDVESACKEVYEHLFQEETQEDFRRAVPSRSSS